MTCSICMDEYSLPVTTPCGHKYCFLCIKGVGGGCCPLCRSNFDVDSLNTAEAEHQVISADMPIKWLYKSASGDGWWYFDHTQIEMIENHYQNKRLEPFIINIGGITYIMNFRLMTQINTHTNAIRGIMRVVDFREIENENIKGTAGINTKFG